MGITEIDLCSCVQLFPILFQLQSEKFSFHHCVITTVELHPKMLADSPVNTVITAITEQPYFYKKFPGITTRGQLTVQNFNQQVAEPNHAVSVR